MFDFFDEDFPLSKKQEDERKKLEQKKAAEDEEESVPGFNNEDDERLENIKIEPLEDNKDGDIFIEEPKLDLGDIDIETLDDDEPEEYEEEISDAELTSPVEQYREFLNAKLEDIAGAEEAEDEFTEITEDSEYSEEPQVEKISSEETTENAGDIASKSYEEKAAEQVEDITDIPAENVPAMEEASPEQEVVSEDEVSVTESVAEDEISAPENISEDDIPAPQENPEPENIHSSIITEKQARKLDSLDDIEAHLHEELRSLGEKLDSMEKVVDGMEDGELPEGFEYEYDERYYSEEDTPAYKHPELYSSKPEFEDGEEDPPAPRITMTENKSFRPKQITPIAPKKTSEGPEITIKLNTSALVKAGAAAACILALAGIFGKKKKKRD